MAKKVFSILLSILTVTCFAFPLYASAETQAATTELPQAEVIGTITLAENGEFTITPMAAATLTCSLKTSGAKYYAYAKIQVGIPSSLKVSVYLKNSAGTTIASSTNSSTGTICETNTSAVTLAPGTYTVYATGSADSTPVSLTKYYSVP